eukprot:c18049_g1_i1 orf=440-1387(-)
MWWYAGEQMLLAPPPLPRPNAMEVVGLGDGGLLLQFAKGNSQCRRRLFASLSNRSALTMGVNLRSDAGRFGGARHPVGGFGVGRKASGLMGVRCCAHDSALPPQTNPYASASVTTATLPASGSKQGDGRSNRVEERIEGMIYNCRFLTLMAVGGSLAGSLLCFFKGCSFVVDSFVEYFHSCLRGFGTGKVILLLIEAIDVYLMGTVMLIFGMGLYELFISSLEVPSGNVSTPRTPVSSSSFFGLFRLREHPKWLEIHSLDELKTKLGHVIVMVLLVGMFEKSKKVQIHSGMDLLCFAASILLSSSGLYLLAKLHG